MTTVTATPLQHPSDELLLEYAAGATAEGASLILACHLTLCPTCRRGVRAFEGIAGALLEARPAPPTPVAPDALARVLARLDDAAQPAPAERVASKALGALGLPRPLLRALGDEPDPRWRFWVPGVESIRVPLAADQATARLVKLRPGLSIPLHDHGGAEYTIIFRGALDDDRGRFARGDVSVRDAGERHVQRVDDSEPCVALLVQEGRLVPLTLRGRLLSLFAGV